MLYRLFFVFITTALLISSTPPTPTKLTYVYNEDIEGYEIQTTWIIEVKADGLSIDGDNPLGTTQIQFASDYSLNKFAYQSKDESAAYTLERNGDEVIAKGIVRNRDRTKVYKLNNLPWLQEFGFGLRNFMLSSETAYKFCLINPGDLAFVKMVAKKKKIETIQIQEQEFKARKVSVSLQGFKSIFWSAEMWFDVETHDLLMYQADQGPDTAFTVVTFLTKSILN